MCYQSQKCIQTLKICVRSRLTRLRNFCKQREFHLPACLTTGTDLPPELLHIYVASILSQGSSVQSNLCRFFHWTMVFQLFTFISFLLRIKLKKCESHIWLLTETSHEIIDLLLTIQFSFQCYCSYSAGVVNGNNLKVTSELYI